MENLFQIKIRTARESLHESLFPEGKNKTAVMHTFLDALLDLNLLKNRKSGLFDETVWNAFVTDTAGKVKKALDDVAFYLTIKSVPYGISWEYDEWKSWIEICLLLSEIAFLKETYNNYIEEDDFAVIGDDELKEFLKSRSSAGDLPDDYIPEGIPSAHWWWWYPGESE